MCNKCNTANRKLSSLNHMPASERGILCRIVRDALRMGFAISVNDGEETTVRRSTDRFTILDACASTEMDYLTFHKDGDQIGTVMLVYGNGCDLISDYTDSATMTAILASASAWADKCSMEGV